MRVAVLAHSFPRFAGDTHGPFVERLCEALAARGHEMHVLVPFDPQLETERPGPLQVHAFRYVVPDGAHRLGYSRTLKRDVGLKLSAYAQAPLYFAAAEVALRRLIRDHGIELVHAHWILPNGFVASRAAGAAGIPYAATLHGSDVFMAERNPLFSAMARSALRGAAYVTSCSGELRDRLLALGGRRGAERWADKVLLVANGTDVAPATAAQQAALADRFDLSGRLVVAVGRLVYKKGFRYLLEAAPAILASDPRVRIVIGGGGDIEAELRAQAEALGLGERVLFTGGLSHPEVLALIASAELFVMPSVRDPRGNVDGLPIVVLEAMAAAKPVVATDVSGMPLAIEDEVSGLLVAEQQPQALAAAVTRVLQRPELGRALGAAAAQRVADDLNWPAVAAIHDRLYRAAAAGRAPAAALAAETG